MQKCRKTKTSYIHEQCIKNYIFVLDSLQPETHSDLWASITEWGSVQYGK